MDVNDIFSHIYRARNIPHVVPTINKPLGVDIVTNWCETAKSVWLCPWGIAQHEVQGLFKLAELTFVLSQELDLSFRVLQLQAMMLRMLCRSFCLCNYLFG